MKKLSIVLISCLMVAACQKSIPSDVYGIVVFSSGETELNSKIIQVGAKIKNNDVVRTMNGIVEIQSRNGTLVKVKPFSEISMKYEGVSNNDSISSVKRGDIIFNVSKQDRKTKFEVITPTAIAGVRGTTLSVAVVGKESVVSVYSGKVAVSNQGVERIITDKQEAKTNIEGTGLNVQEKVFSTVETIELETAQPIDEKAVRESMTAEKLDSTTLAALHKRAYETKLETVYEKIEKSGVGYRSNNNDSQMTLILKGGVSKRGVVISQTDNVLMFYEASSGKFLKYNKNEVVSLEF